MDLQDVMKLLELMEARQLEEIEIEQEGVRIKLRKSSSTPTIAPVFAAPMPVAMAPAGAAAAAPAADAAATDPNIVKINSPMVGTFYRSPSPDADPFVSEGDRVTPEQVVCIIEAMKVMNEIRAEVEGEIVSILIENGESVEFGQPMMTVRRAGAAK